MSYDTIVKKNNAMQHLIRNHKKMLNSILKKKIVTRKNIVFDCKCFVRKCISIQLKNPADKIYFPRNIRLLFLTVYKRIGFYSLYAYKSAYVVFGCGWLKIEHVNAVDYVSVMHSSSLKSIFSIEKNWLLVLHYAWRRSASTRFHGLNITYPWVDVNFHNIEYSLLLCIVASFFLCVHPSIRIWFSFRYSNKPISFATANSVTPPRHPSFPLPHLLPLRKFVMFPYAVARIN